MIGIGQNKSTAIYVFSFTCNFPSQQEEINLLSSFCISLSLCPLLNELNRTFTCFFSKERKAHFYGKLFKFLVSFTFEWWSLEMRILMLLIGLISVSVLNHVCQWMESGTCLINVHSNIFWYIANIRIMYWCLWKYHCNNVNDKESLPFTPAVPIQWHSI